MSNDEPHIDSSSEGDELLRFAPPTGDDEAGATRAGSNTSARVDPAAHFTPALDTPHAYSRTELLKYAPPGRRGSRKRSTTTINTPAPTPTRAVTASAQAKPAQVKTDTATATTTAPAPAPSQPQSEDNNKTTAARIKLAFWVICSLIALISHLVRLGSNTNTPAPVKVPYLASTQAPTTPSPGYSGTAQNTHALSPAWAAGVSTAWTIPKPSGVATVTHPMYVEGSTLYVAFGVEIGRAHV